MEKTDKATLGGMMQAIETGDATESEVAPHALSSPCSRHHHWFRHASNFFQDIINDATCGIISTQPPPSQRPRVWVLAVSTRRIQAATIQMRDGKGRVEMNRLHWLGTRGRQRGSGATAGRLWLQNAT
jgi:hypothetical protein